MKNIHVLPTEKPIRLYYHKSLKYCVLTNNIIKIAIEGVLNQNIYITSDEEIKEGDWCIDEDGLMKCTAHSGVMNHYFSKIILTTDQDLIKGGVQAIGDEFLEWFIKNPSCKEVEIELKPMFPMYKTFKEYINTPPFYGNLKYKIIIPKEEPKQETLEEVANRLFEEKGFNTLNHYDTRPSFIECAKFYAKKMYSEEVTNHLKFIYDRMVNIHNENENYDYMIKFKNIIKKL